ncbi:MAG: ABC transporter permease, partial [Betaproteobacteria bacterium]
MSVFVLRRLLTLLATLAGASVLIFLVLEVLPADAALVQMGADAAPQAVQALATKLGLDRPPLERYLAWVGGMVRGDLGLSYAYSTSVAELVWERLAVTVPLAFMAMALTTVMALSAGVYAAARHHRLGDLGVMGLTQLGMAIPNFWFAILLILLFSVQL